MSIWTTFSENMLAFLRYDFFNKKANVFSLPFTCYASSAPSILDTVLTLQNFSALHNKNIFPKYYYTTFEYSALHCTQWNAR
jgi:hypothetical protein